MVILQAIMAFIVMERHWDNVTRALAKTVAREIAFVAALYEASPKTPNATEHLLRTANQTLDVIFSLERPADLPAPKSKPLFSLVDSKLTKYLEQRIDLPISVDTRSSPGYIDVRIELEKDLVLRMLAKVERAAASSTPIFLTWLVGSSLVLIAVAILFLRKQIKPIQELASAAHGFGTGREVNNFRPRGAREVKEAATAFINMKERIEKHVEQRTAMLAGVSHDIGTVLTRLKLQLVLLERNPKLRSFKKDVDEMQRMLEGYMAFARGDDGEKSTMTDVAAILRDVTRHAKRTGQSMSLRAPHELVVPVKPDAFKRCVSNLVTNAVRYSGKVKVAAKQSDHQLLITIDDSGPGIPPDRREDVFKPFYRLDHARNQNETGTGLGLSIARDIARAHGGDVRLSDSPAGGLRAEIRIPV
jgi:two-component system osmolarity sensor histidine kinase EnvZ